MKVALKTTYLPSGEMLGERSSSPRNSPEGLHDDQREADRLLAAVATIIAHRVANPDPVVTRADTVGRAERSHQLDGTTATGGGSLRLQGTYRIRLSSLAKPRSTYDRHQWSSGGRSLSNSPSSRDTWRSLGRPILLLRSVGVDGGGWQEKRVVMSAG